MNYLFFIMIVYTAITKCHACTDFILMDEKSTCAVGRSMEFGTDLNSEIIISKANHSLKRSLINGQVGMEWTQKYNFIGLNALNIDDLIVDGMNEMGLSFGALWMPGTKYPKLKSNNLNHTIALQDIGRWLLGTFSTVKEAHKALKKVAIYPAEITALGEVPPLHFSLHDRNGNSLVVEFISGKMKISNNPVGVLTNSPKFEWHITNLRNYINLSAINSTPTNFDGTVLDPTGQGSGMLGLPGDWTPPSRFIRIAVIKEFVKKAISSRQNVNLALHFLNTVDIPYGVIQEKNGKNFDYTQWIVVKDLTNNILYYRTYDNLNIKSIDLSDALKKNSHKIQLK